MLKLYLWVSFGILEHLGFQIYLESDVGDQGFHFDARSCGEVVARMKSH